MFGRVQFGMAADLYQRTIYHNQVTLFLTIIRSRRKTLAIHVLASGIEVRVPLKCPWLEIDRFIESRLDWMVSAQGQVESQPPAPEYLSGEYHQYLGDMVELIVKPAHKNGVSFRDGKIHIRSKEPYASEYNKRLFYGFLRDQAQQIFADRLTLCAAAFPLQVAPRSLRIRRMRARWGSCSETGEICLNTLLVQKDPRAIDLVINHELCHLYHFNHDADFYRLMDRSMPGWRELEPLLQPPTRAGKSLMPEQQLMLL